MRACMYACMHAYRSVGHRRPRKEVGSSAMVRPKPPFVCQMLCHAMPCHALRCDAAAYPPDFVASSLGHQAGSPRSLTPSLPARCNYHCPLPTAHTVYRTCCMHTQPNTYAQRVCVREAVKQAGSDDLTSTRHIATLSAACTTLVT